MIQLPDSLKDAQSINYDSGENISLCLIGGKGVGKSHFIASMPEPILVYSRETNNATLLGFKREGLDIEVIGPPADLDVRQRWPYFRDRFVAAVRNKQFAARTIAVDGYAMLNADLVLHKQLDTPQRDSMARWGQVLVVQRNTIADLLAGVHVGYHIVATCHETDIIEERKDLEGKVLETKVIGYRPAIQGAFKDEFTRKFDVCLVMKNRSKTVVVDGKATPSSEFVGYVVPPDPRWEEVPGDGIGGKGGRKVLPPVIPDPTFKTLCGLWGVEGGFK